MLMSVSYMVNIQRILSMSVDVRQMLCSISHLNNNGQKYLLSGSVRYISPVRCDRGFTVAVSSGHRTQWLNRLKRILPMLFENLAE